MSGCTRAAGVAIAGRAAGRPRRGPGGAVTTPSTLVAVIAGAGSGKTRVLTRRIAYRVATGTADARHTLALTFTREAAGELRRRLRRTGVREPRRGRHVPRRRARRSCASAGATSTSRRRRWSTTATACCAEVAGGRPGRGARRRGRVGRGAGVDAGRLRAQRGTGRPAGAATAPERVAERARRLRGAEATRGRRRPRRPAASAARAAGRRIRRGRRSCAGASATCWSTRRRTSTRSSTASSSCCVGGRDDLYLVGDPAQAIYGFNGADPVAAGRRRRPPPGRRDRPPARQPPLHAADRRRRHPRAARQRARPRRRARRGATAPPVRVVAADDEEHEAAPSPRSSARSTRRCCAPARSPCWPAPTPSCPAGARRSTARRADRPAAAAGGRQPVAARRAHGHRAAVGRPAAGWAHDVLDADPTAPARPTTPTRAERRVAAAVLEFLRDQPFGDGAALRSWIATSDPFAVEGAGGGVELLTFHGAKGREWHTVVVTGVETGLVPHRTATTNAAQAEEARLLYVALTRATDRLVVTWAGRRGGYRRRVSPLIDGSRRRAGPGRPAAGRAAHGSAHVAGAPRAADRRGGSTPPGRPACCPAEVCSDAELAAIVDGARRPRRRTWPTRHGDGPADRGTPLPGIRAALDHRPPIWTRDPPPRPSGRIRAITVATIPAQIRSWRRSAPRSGSVRRRPGRPRRGVVARLLALAGVAVDDAPLGPPDDRRRRRARGRCASPGPRGSRRAGSPTTRTPAAASGWSVPEHVGEPPAEQRREA